MASQPDEFNRLVTQLVDEHRRQVRCLVADVRLLQNRLHGITTDGRTNSGSDLEGELSYLSRSEGVPWGPGDCWANGSEETHGETEPLPPLTLAPVAQPGGEQAWAGPRPRPMAQLVLGLQGKSEEQPGRPLSLRGWCGISDDFGSSPSDSPKGVFVMQPKSHALQPPEPPAPKRPQPALPQSPQPAWQLEEDFADLDEDERSRSADSPSVKQKLVKDNSRASSPTQGSLANSLSPRPESEAATSCSQDCQIGRGQQQQQQSQQTSIAMSLSAGVAKKVSSPKRATFSELSSREVAIVPADGDVGSPGKFLRGDSSNDEDAALSSWALLRAKFKKEGADGSSSLTKFASIRTNQRSKSVGATHLSTPTRSDSKRGSSFTRVSNRHSTLTGKLNVQRNTNILEATAEGDLTKVVRLAASVAKMTASLDAKMLEATTDEGFKLRSHWVMDEQEMMRIKANHMRTNGLLFARTNTKQSFTETDKPLSSQVVLQPQCRLRLMWDLFAVAMLSYDCIMLPMQVFELPKFVLFQAMEWIGVLYWTMDIGFSFLTGAYINGELEMDLKKVVLFYLKGWFPFDLGVVLPEWVSIFVGDQNETVSSSGMARTLRGGRIFRFIRFIRLLRLVKVQRVLGDLKARINSSYLLVALSIAKLVIATLVMVHALACTWYFFGNQEEGWVYAEGIQNQTLQERYLFSFQWSLTRLHPTNMSENMDLRTVSERMLAIFATLIAMVVSSLFISSITNTMAQLTTLRQSRNRKMQAFRDYVRQYQVSTQLTVRVKKYIDRTGSDNRQGNCEEELAKTLPSALLGELRYEAMYPIVINHGLFNMFHMKHPRAEWDVCYKVLKANSAFPSETIFTTGDACSRMLFIVAGEMLYTKGREMSSSQAARRGSRVELNRNLKELSVVPISWLCEAVLWTTWFNCGELLSVADAIFIELSANAFGALIKDHEPAMIDAVIWGRCFVDDLNSTPASDLTDCALSLASTTANSRESIGSNPVNNVKDALNPVLAAWD